MSILKLGQVTLGEGIPKICVPLTSSTPEGLLEEAKIAEQLPCQIIEWRADFLLAEFRGAPLQEVCDLLKNILGILKVALSKPIIFTIRTAEEGGQISLSSPIYYHFNKIIAETGLADMIDIEAFESDGQIEQDEITEFVEFAHEKGVLVMLSDHDFENTPDQEELATRYFVMQELGGDVMKLAVMPQQETDVADLLEIASMMKNGYAQIPFVAIAMGELGLTTRICGGEFGSVITFASGKNASAPGQIDAQTLSNMLTQYYKG